jgi:hypothetical protein
MRAVVTIVASLFLAGQAVAANIELLSSQDDAACEHFKTPRVKAPIPWERLADSQDGENYRAVFDFENSGSKMEVRRREDLMLAFAGTYFLVAPPGTNVPLDWFRAQAGTSAGFVGPPAPMKMYWQEDMNVDAEVVEFNKLHYVRTTPIYDDMPLIMILEPKDGKLRELCRYKRPD